MKDPSDTKYWLSTKITGYIVWVCFGIWMFSLIVVTILQVSIILVNFGVFESQWLWYWFQ